MKSAKDDAKKFYYWLTLAIFLVYLLIRLSSLSREIIWEDTNLVYFFDKIYGGDFSHTDISSYFHYFVYSLFGVSYLSSRLVPLIGLVLTFVVFYFFLRENYSWKTTLLSLGILAISVWDVFFSTTYTVTNEYTTLFILTFLLYFYRYLKTEKTLALFLSGIALGLAVSNYEASLIIAAPVLLFLYLTKGKKNILTETAVFGSGVAVVVLLFVAAHLIYYGPKSLILLVEWGSLDKLGRFTFGMRYLLYLGYTFLGVLLYMCPLLIIGFLESGHVLLKGRYTRSKPEPLLSMILFLGFFFFMIVVPPGNYPMRYIGSTVPLMCLLAAQFFISHKLNLRDCLLSALISVGFFALFLFLNLDGKLVNIKQLASQGTLGILNSYFLLVHTNDSGTTIKIWLLLAGLLIGATAFFIARLRNCKFHTLCRILLFAAVMGFSIFALQEYLLHWSGINYDAAYSRLAEYIEHNKTDGIIYSNLDVRFFSDPYGIRNNISLRELCYSTYEMRIIDKKMDFLILGERNKEIYSRLRFINNYEIEELNWTERDELINKIKNEKAELIYINDYLYYGSDSDFMHAVEGNCTGRLIIRDKGLVTGFVYQC